MAEQDPEIVAALDQGQYNVKYQAPNTPLEAEERLKMMVPLPWYSEQRYREWYNRTAPAMPELQGILAKEMSDKQKQNINTEFAYEFQKWLMGRSYWNLAVAKDGITPLTPWLCTPRTDIEGVVEYERQWPQKRAEFQLALVKLWMLGPKNLNEAFLYYKYLVCGETLDPVFSDDIRFLDEYAIFFPNSGAFYNATNYGVMPHKNRQRPGKFPNPIDFAQDQMLHQQLGKGHPPYPTINPQTYRDGFNPGYNVGPPGAPGGPGGGGGGPGVQQLSNRLDLFMRYLQQQAASFGGAADRKFNDIGKVLMKNQDDLNTILKRFESVDQLAQHLNDQNSKKPKRERKRSAGRTAEDGAMVGVPVAQELKNLYDAVGSSKEPLKDFETFLERISNAPLSKEEREMAKGIYEMFQNAGSLEAVQEAQQQLEKLRQRHAEAEAEAERIRRESAKERMENNAKLEAVSLEKQEHERNIAKQTQLLRETQGMLEIMKREQAVEAGKHTKMANELRNQLNVQEQLTKAEQAKRQQETEFLNRQMLALQQQYENELARMKAISVPGDEYSRAAELVAQKEAEIIRLQTNLKQMGEFVQAKMAEFQEKENQFRQAVEQIGQSQQGMQMKYEAMERELRETIENQTKALQQAYKNGVDFAEMVQEEEMVENITENIQALQDYHSELVDARMESGSDSGSDSGIEEEMLQTQGNLELLRQQREAIRPITIQERFAESEPDIEFLADSLRRIRKEVAEGGLTPDDLKEKTDTFEWHRGRLYGLVKTLLNMAKENEKALLDAQLRNALAVPKEFNFEDLQALPVVSSVHKPRPMDVDAPAPVADVKPEPPAPTVNVKPEPTAPIVVDVKPKNLMFNQNDIDKSREIVKDQRAVLQRLVDPHIPTAVEQLQELARQGTSNNPIPVDDDPNEFYPPVKTVKNTKSRPAARNYDKLRKVAAERPKEQPKIADLTTPPKPVAIPKAKAAPPTEPEPVITAPKRKKPVPEPVSQSSPLPPSEATSSEASQPSERVQKLVKKFKDKAEEKAFNDQSKKYMEELLKKIKKHDYRWKDIDMDIRNILVNYASHTPTGNALAKTLYSENWLEEPYTADVMALMAGKTYDDFKAVFNETEDKVANLLEAYGQKEHYWTQSVPTDVYQLTAALIMNVQQMQTVRGHVHFSDQLHAYLRILKLMKKLEKY